MEVERGGNNDLFNGTDLATVSQALPALPPQPVEALSADDTDAIFAAELNKLSMEERDEVLHDVHGVSDVMNEDSDFVAGCIKQLIVQLGAIPDPDKKAYLLAKNQNEAYVMDEKFLLMFLRADRFDIKTAAARFVAFFEGKLELFGPERLGRDIVYSDLSDDDKACLHSGYAQVLNGRDRSGRAILCLLPMIRSFKTVENRVSLAIVMRHFYNTPKLAHIVSLPFQLNSRCERYTWSRCSHFKTSKHKNEELSAWPTMSAVIIQLTARLCGRLQRLFP
jgi:hypothetical protein